MTRTPAPLLLSPDLGEAVEHIPAPLETEGVLWALPRGHCRRSPPPPGSQPTDPGTGPVDGASVAGLPRVLSSGQDARAQIGAPQAWTVDVGPLDMAGSPDPSGFGTRQEAGAWPTHPSCGPHPVTRPRVRKRQAGRAWARGGGRSKLAPPRVPRAGGWGGQDRKGLSWNVEPWG